MKTNQDTLTLALNLARVTQQAYNMLKSPKTQRIRNPFPLRVLVKLVLPTVKARETVTTFKTMTANQVVHELRTKGFTIHAPSVKSVLSQSRFTGDICSVRSTQQPYPGAIRPLRFFLRRGVNA